MKLKEAKWHKKIIQFRDQQNGVPLLLKSDQKKDCIGLFF